MSVTDELRRMLDERGVKWDELQSYEGGKMTRWRDSMGRYVTAYDEGMVTFFDDFYWQPTPQQAVDATLGRGTCKPVVSDNLTESEGMGDAWADCSECGHLLFVLTDPNSQPPNYCPNCGRKVMNI